MKLIQKWMSQQHNMSSEKQGLKTGILNIQDLGFQVNIFEEPNTDDIAIGYDMNLSFNEIENWIQFIIEVEFVNSKNQVRIIYSTVLSKFFVENLNQYFTEDNEAIQLPHQGLETLFGLAFTHTRAILAKNLAGTSHSHLYIPIINPTILLNSLLKQATDRIMEKPK